MKLHHVFCSIVIFSLQAMEMAIDMQEMHLTVEDYLSTFAQACATNNDAPVTQLLKQPIFQTIIRECSPQQYQQMQNCIRDMKPLGFHFNVVNTGAVGSVVSVGSLLLIYFMKCYNVVNPATQCYALPPSELAIGGLGYCCILAKEWLHNKAQQRKKVLYAQLENLRNPQHTQPNHHDAASPQSRLLIPGEEV